MTNVIHIVRRKPKSMASYAAAMTTARFSGRLGTEFVTFERGVFFKIATTDGSGEHWPCVIRSKLVLPILATLKPGDPVSVCGVIAARGRPCVCWHRSQSFTSIEGS